VDFLAHSGAESLYFGTANQPGYLGLKQSRPQFKPSLPKFFSRENRKQGQGNIPVPPGGQSGFLSNPFGKNPGEVTGQALTRPRGGK
jgi:hypothetical protein